MEQMLSTLQTGSNTFHFLYVYRGLLKKKNDVRIQSCCFCMILVTLGWQESREFMEANANNMLSLLQSTFWGKKEKRYRHEPLLLLESFLMCQISICRGTLC